MTRVLFILYVYPQRATQPNVVCMFMYSHCIRALSTFSSSLYLSLLRCECGQKCDVSLSASVCQRDVGGWEYCFGVHLIHVTSKSTHDGEANRVKHYQSKRFGKIRKEHNLPRRIFLTASHELFFPSLLCTAFALRCLPPPPQ